MDAASLAREIVAAIDAIAFQTNILALNAAAATQLKHQAHALTQAVAAFRLA